MSQVKTIKECEIKDKIKTFTINSEQYFELEQRNVKNIKCCHFNGSKEIQISYSFGFGENEEFKKLLFEEELLDEKLKLFSVKKETQTLKPTHINSDYVEPKNNLAMAEKTENNLKVLRSHLFSSIRKLEEGTMDYNQAKSMAQLAQTIINSAKLEMEYKKLLTDKPRVELLD